MCALAQGSTLSYKASPPFEGAIQFKTEYFGIDTAIINQGRPNKKMDMYFRRGDFIIYTYEGRLPTTVLYINDSNRSFVLDDKNKRVFRREPFRYRVKEEPEALPIGDSLLIAGVECYGYRLKPRKVILNETDKAAAKDPNSGDIVTLYVSPKYHVDLNLFQGKLKSHGYFLARGLNGAIPLKVIIKSSNNITLTNTAFRIIPRTFEVTDFRLPTDWKIENMVDYRH